MERNYGLIFTLCIGLFFLIGFILVRTIKDKKKLTYFSTGMAFIVMVGMLIFDLIPEIIELNSDELLNKNFSVALSAGFIILGIVLLKCLDIVLPHHQHNHNEHESKHEHEEHTTHVGLMTSISLVIHNIIEGMSIFIITCENIMTGFMATVAVGMHNIPLGIEIASNTEKNKKSITDYIILGLLLLSSSIGALIIYLSGIEIPEVIELILLSISCGMIIFISLFELLPEIKNYSKERQMYYGIITGIVLVILMILLQCKGCYILQTIVQYSALWIQKKNSLKS